MGWLDFTKSIGEKIFGASDNASEKLQEHIESRNPGVQELSVQVEEGIAKVSGTAPDAESLQKVALLAGNVEGIEKVDVESVAVQNTETVESDYYEIASGDTLSAIAKKFYGNGNLYAKIFEANKEVIVDADKIYPGQKIRIPKL